MLRVTAIVLACACTVYAEIYNGYSPNSIHDPPRSMDTTMFNKEIVDDQINGFVLQTPSKTEWEWAEDKKIYHPGSISINTDEYNTKTITSYPGSNKIISSHPSHYPDWSTYPIIRPRYPKYPADSNMPQNPILTPQFPDTQYPTPQYPNAEYPNIISPQCPYIPQYTDEQATPDQDINLPSKLYPLDPTFYKPTFPSSIHLNEPITDNHSKQPPKYTKALYDFDNAKEEITTNLYTPYNRNLDRYRYLGIMSALDGMIRTMADRPWEHYDQEYYANVPGFVQYGEGGSSKVASQIICVFNEANESIKKIRKIIKSCGSTSINCDLVIQALVLQARSPELQKEADLLMALGTTSSLYLKMADKVDRVATKGLYHQGVYAFVMSSKNYLKPLIFAATEARRLIPSSQRCYPY